MKRLLILLVLAAGCGSTHTETVTAPAVTVTKTVQQTPAECRTMGLSLAAALRLENSAAKGYAELILPAYRAGVYSLPVSKLLAKESRQTAKVSAATKKINGATTLIGKCFG